MTDTEVGFKGIIRQTSSNMCIKEQQHAEGLLCLEQHCTTQGSRGERVGATRPHLVLRYGYLLSFPRGMRKE